MCFTDLLDRGEKINLPTIMISHIARIANTSKDHDMGYGFLLTLVFGELGIPLQKRVGFQVSDEIGSSALIGSGFKVTKGSNTVSEQGPLTPFGPVPGMASTSNAPTFDTLVQDQILLKGEVAKVKQAFTKEKALNAKHYEYLLSAISALTAKFTSPSSSSYPIPAPSFQH